jgi:hypothetical protein
MPNLDRDCDRSGLREIILDRKLDLDNVEAGLDRDHSPRKLN